MSHTFTVPASLLLSTLTIFLVFSRSSVPFCSSCGVIATNVLFSHMPTVPALGVIPEALSWSSYSSNVPLRKHAFFASRSSCMLQACAVDVSRLRSFKTLTTCQAACSQFFLGLSMQSWLQVQRMVRKTPKDADSAQKPFPLHLQSHRSGGKSVDFCCQRRCSGP